MVEDEDALSAPAANLDKEGYQVTVAADGEEAATGINEGSALDLIVLDFGAAAGRRGLLPSDSAAGDAQHADHHADRPMAARKPTASVADIGADDHTVSNT